MGAPMTAAAPANVTQRGILRVFLPLALSWLFMAIESPISIAIIGRMPDSKVNTAAFLILMAVSLWIESPVIDLLSTSTTLAKNGANYQAVRRFTLWLMVWVSIAHAAVAFTPLFDWVMLRLLGLPAPVAEACRAPLQIMTPWSALIGWRRHIQGLLIRSGQTRPISVGTGIRVATIATTGFTLYATTELRGVIVAAIALILSVAAEAAFIQWVGREAVSSIERTTTDDPRLGWRDLAGFHFPLTAATMFGMTTTPIISAALAKTPQPVLAMASWQVAISLLWLMRTVTFALPEVVISLYRDEPSRRELRQFCLRVGAVCLGTMAVIVAMGLDSLFFRHVLRADPETVAAAHLAMACGIALPLVNAATSYVRGMLTAHRLTMARLWSIGGAIASLALSLAIGVMLQVPGPVVPALALTVAQLVELGILALFWKRSEFHPSNRTLLEPILSDQPN